MNKKIKSSLASLVAVLLAAGVVYAVSITVLNSPSTIQIKEPIVATIENFARDEGNEAVPRETICGTLQIENIGTVKQFVRVKGTLSEGLTSNHWLFDVKEDAWWIAPTSTWSDTNICVTIASGIEETAEPTVSFEVSRE